MYLFVQARPVQRRKDPLITVGDIIPFRTYLLSHIKFCML